MYLIHHKVEVTQVFNGLPYILYEELLINPKNFITRSDIERSTLSIWDKEKRTFIKTNEIHNEDAT